MSSTTKYPSTLRGVWAGLSKPVFIPAVVLIVAALGFATWYGAEYGDDAEAAFTNLRDVIGVNIGWWYILVVTAMLLFAFWAALSKAGKIRLGRDDERPEFSMFSWFAMLFSAGMGIGLIFSGVSEPLSHLTDPPQVAGVEAGTDEAGRAAIGQSMFHWGFHAWGIYVIVGLGLAYMTYRRGRPLSIRWLLEPLFGRKLIESWVGHLIDVVAVVGTIFGVSTSLGMGALQIQAGLSHLGWFDPSNTVLIVLVVVIIAITTFSVVSGLHRGLLWLSNANMVLAAVFAMAVLLIGPTVFLLRSMIQNAGEYMQTIPQLAFVTGADATDGWTLEWTLFNQAWFLSWAPFVGMFIARISRGRTVREFILGSLLAPTAVTLIWFTVFGSSGIFYQLTDGTLVGDDGAVDADTTLFTFLNELPIADITVAILALAAIVIITLFFITSADSSSLVVDVLCHGGLSETPRTTRVFWAFVLGASGALLLMAGGEAALTVLQVSSLAGAAPLSVVYVLAMVALWRMFRYEVTTTPRYVHVRTQAAPSALLQTAEKEADSPAELEDNMRQLLKNQQAANGAPSTTFRGVSATLAGFPDAIGSSEVTEPYSQDGSILAVQDVPAHAVTVNPETGSIAQSGVTESDPTGGELFDTPEFDESVAGEEQRSYEYLQHLQNGPSTS